MFGIFVLTLLVISVSIVLIAYGMDRWSNFRRDHLEGWLHNVQIGLCEINGMRLTDVAQSSESQEVICRVKRTPFLWFLAKHTRCRVVKYDGGFFTEIKTLGTKWVELNKRHIGTWNKSNRFDNIERAESAIALTVADIQCWMKNSVPEDPNRYKRVVVAHRTVTAKDTE